MSDYPIKETAFGRFYITRESLSLHMNKQDPNIMWEDHLRPVFDQYATGRTVIEVGASAGWHTVYLSRIASAVVSFEPQKPQYETLNANLKLNDCPNVTTHNLAVYSSARRMRTNEPIDYARHSHEACAMHLVEDDGGCIKAITLDSIQSENVGLIKIDAQGCDLHVLLGSVETIKRERPALLYEYDWMLAEQHGHTLQQYEAFIASIGYKAEALSIRDWIATPL